MSKHPALFPANSFNQQLEANVHPTDWVNPQPADSYQLVVVGAGTAGLVTAAGAAGLGAKVALIEKNLMGGDCLNVGCVPSKGIIRSARAVADVLQADKFGVRVPDGIQVDFTAVMDRMRRIRADLSAIDSTKRFSELGVDVFLGEASFAGEDRIRVGEQTLPFKKAVIATGARPVVLPFEGLAEAGYLTNETIFSLTELPKRLLVVGMGPIGCELAQAFRRFGSEVVMVGLDSHLLPLEDQEAARILANVFEREGIEVHPQSTVKCVEAAGDEKRVHLDVGGSIQERTFDAILLGVGRQPNVEGLNLEAAGVLYDSKKGVQVNDRLQTTNANIYAAGDICLRYKFTHTADAAARIVIQNALFLGQKRLSALNIPWCTYTDPEIAHVGLYEKQAQDLGHKVTSFTVPLQDVDRARLEGEDEGFVRIHVRKGSDRILGATIVARHAGEMISEISVAMSARFGLGKLAQVIHPYPTVAEAIRKAGDAYQRTRLSPFVRKLLRLWLKWKP